MNKVKSPSPTFIASLVGLREQMKNVIVNNANRATGRITHALATDQLALQERCYPSVG